MSGPRAPAPAPGGPNRTDIRTLLEFTDIENNDVAGGYVDLTIHEVDPNNVGTASSPATLKSHLSELVKDGQVVMLGIVDPQGKMKEYFLPAIFNARTGSTSPLAGKLIANIGDFDKEDGGFYLTEIKTVHMALIANSVLCSTPETISTAAQAHTANDRFLVGPYAAGDAGVTATHSRKFFEIPYFLISKCGKAAPGGQVTVQYFWTTLYPLIVAKGAEVVAACKPLIDAFRLAATNDGTGSSPMDVAEALLPSVIGPDDALKTARKRLFRQLLPFRRQDPQAPTADASVARAMDDQTDVLRDQYELQKNQAAEAKQAKLRKQVGGDDQLRYLCEQTGAADHKQLPELMRLLIDASTDSNRDKLLNDASKQMAHKLKIAMAPMYPPGFATRMITERWAMSADDEPDTGSVFNPLLLSAPKTQVQEMLENAHAAAPDRTSTRVTAAERRELDKSKLSLATPRTAIAAMRDLHVLLNLVCVDPSTHPLTVWSKGFYERLAMGGMDEIMLHPARGGSHMQHLQGVQFQITVGSHLKSYSTRNTALDPDLIFGDIAEHEHWERVSRTLTVLQDEYGLPTVRTATRRFQGLDLDADSSVMVTRSTRRPAPIVDTDDDMSVLSQPTAPAPAAPPAWVPARGRAAAPATGSAGGTANRSTFVRNANFDREFWLLRTGRESALGAKGSDLIKAAEAGICAPVPRSKASPLRNMCINFHVRGHCHDNCPYSYDHVAYTRAEFEADSGLAGWMDADPPNFRQLTTEQYTQLGIPPPRRSGGRRNSGGRGRNRGGRTG